MQTWSTIVFKSSSSFQKLWLPINWEAKIVAVTHTHTHTDRVYKAGEEAVRWGDAANVKECEADSRGAGTQRAEGKDTSEVRHREAWESDLSDCLSMWDDFSFIFLWLSIDPKFQDV